MGYGVRITGMTAAILLVACSAMTATAEERADEAGAAEMVEPAGEWRAVAPENLLLIDTAKGLVTVELNPDFAPGHVTRIRELADAHILDGERFYRVIEAFVAQAGLKDDERIAPWPMLQNENDRPLGGEGFVPLGNADLFASEVGHIDGFAVGRDEGLGQEWLLHCPGAMAMARDVDPDSGSTEFYIVLDAQRYLDRNLTVFGRVIDGMDHVQALKRGKREVESGVIQAPEIGDEILSFRTAADLPDEERPRWEVMETTSAAFEEFKTGKRVRDEDFFYRKPPEVLDVCSFETPARKVP